MPPDRRLRPGPFLNMFTASALVDALVRRELEALGLRTAWLGILHLIWLNEPITPTDLERLSGIRPTTLRDAVNDLVARREVRREPNPEDRRSTLLSLTPEGERSAREAMRATQGVYKAVAEHLDWPVMELDRPLEEVVDALRAALDG
jgi:DNA-binding MarR family transcriptional regulator